MIINRQIIEEYLQDNDINYDVSNGEFILEHCIFCDDGGNHLYMSSNTGLYHCKKCGAKGNFLQFQMHIGDIPEVKSAIPEQKTFTKIEINKIEKLHKQLLGDQTGLKFLADRGINESAIKKFKLGYENGSIAIPHLVGGLPQNIKFRNIVFKEYTRVPGCQSVLFNTDNLDINLDYAIITEGEFDTIKGTQEGIKNLVATTVGADTFPFDWVKRLEPFKKVYVCYDNDEPGQRGAKKAAEKIGLDKCVNVVLPKKDLNDFLMEYTVKDFEEILKKSRKFDIDEVISIETLADKIDAYLANTDEQMGIKTGYKILDSKVKGFRKEDLILVSGASTVGKTTFLLNIINNMLKEGKKILCFMLEGRMMYFVERLMTIETGQIPALLPPADLQKLKEQFKKYKLYFYSGSQGLLDAEKMVEKTSQCKKVLDIDMVVLDHLHKVVERGKDNYSQLCGKAVSDLKNLAVDQKIPVVVVSHIRKVQKTSAIPTMMDLRDSSFIHQDSDVILMLWSDRENSMMSDNVVCKILKNKTGEDQVDLFYTFDRASGQFKELDENI